MNSWTEFLQREKEQEYFKQIIARVQEDAKGVTIYPKHEDMFNCFKYCSFDNTKVIILGQDPYINEYNGIPEAMGMCFSIPVGVPITPSLRNIYKELQSDLGLSPPSHGDLTSWAKQGVLLLNSALTVKAGLSGSHATYGWHTLTDKAIALLNEKENPLVFILWGAHAKKKRVLITNEHHLILEGAHPSPLAATRGGFFGGKYFSKCNEFLIANGSEPIDWVLRD